jgi:hypothetical protein
MKYDEIISDLNKYVVLVEASGMPATAKMAAIIRSVMELHKPWTMQTDEEGGEAVGCSCNLNIPAFLNPYPCETVQIIERELQ